MVEKHFQLKQSDEGKTLKEVEMFKYQVNEVDRALKFNRILIDDENAKVKDI